MFINRIERAEFNLDEIRRGTLIYAKHRSWKEENPALCTMRLPNGLQYCIRMRKRTHRIIFLYLFRKMENGK